MTRRRSRSAWLLGAAAACLLLGPKVASADYIHVVRPGETLASIAQVYYGDPQRETVLVSENGLTTQGGAAIVVGMRLAVPWVGHHIVQEGETWTQLAERFYGDSRRAFLLVEANDGSMGTQPDVGAEILIPYPLRHIAVQSETLRDISEAYYGDESPDNVRMLRRFNDMRGIRPVRGQVVLVPMSDLELSEEGERLVEVNTGEEVLGGEVRELQARIEEQLPTLREHNLRGRFAEAVGLGNRLLGAGSLTGNQVVSIQRELGTAYVALGRQDLAVEAFRQALSRQPDLELDVARTSPVVMRAFQQARGTGPARDQGGDDGGEPTDAGAPSGE